MTHDRAMMNTMGQFNGKPTATRQVFFKALFLLPIVLALLTLCPSCVHMASTPLLVVFETELGNITVAVDVARAPITGTNFLKYVDGKFYDGGMINRAVRPDNTVRHDVEIQVIQFQSDPARESELLPPIPMERTSETGLRHVDGAISMARMEPDTAQDSFSIVIGNQPEMDFGGRRNPDGQGFAVFGRVVAGMDVVHKIHQAHTGMSGPYETETLEPPVKILKAYRKEPLVLGNSHAGIKAAYAEARAGGGYDKVECRDARGRVSIARAYAMTDPQEYFAETTEAFFGTNDFFPFTRAELKQHDPAMHALLEKLWIPPGQSAPLEVRKIELSASEAPKPNIVIILADDMGYGDPHCFNPRSKIATPNIDRLAREGMRFTDAHSPGPLCHPSRYGLMTGCYPFRTDITLWPKQPLIKEGQMTIASLLKTAGYRTAMVGKWHLGFREEGYDQPLRGGPVDCGFDTFFGLRASTDIPPYFYIRGDRAVSPPAAYIGENHSEGWSPTQGAFWREGGIAPGLELKDVLPRLTDEACAVIGNSAGRKSDARQPLMLYLAYTAPHTPWLPAAEFAGKSGAGMYGDFAMMVDAQIGRVLAALEKSDMMQDTLLVFTSDNGPVWHPADVARLGHDAAGGLRGMKADAWEGGHRMPFIVRWPGRVKPGSVSSQTICFTDLLATFAGICGVKLPEDAGPDSFSFLPVLEGRQPEGQPVRGPIVMQAGSSPAMMIRSGDWKLINRLGSGGFSKPSAVKPGPGDPAGQLYNLREDPEESSNLYLKHPEIVARLEADMGRIVKSKSRGQ